MDLPVTINRKKIKNMYLRVHPDGRITVSAPRRLSDKAIQDFINSRSDWILAQREKMLARQDGMQCRETTYSTGEVHYLWGQRYALVVAETAGKCSVTVAGNASCNAQYSVLLRQAVSGVIHLQAPAGSTTEQRKGLLEEFYRRQLKAAVPPLMEKYIRIVGKTPMEWRIRNMKTKWGTCNVVDKRVWLALNLAKKDPRCLEYVIAHELTHLHEPNHSKAFWARMDVYYPEWREIRKLLNER